MSQLDLFSDQPQARQAQSEPGHDQVAELFAAAEAQSKRHRFPRCRHILIGSITHRIRSSPGIDWAPMWYLNCHESPLIIAGGLYLDQSLLGYIERKNQP